MKHTVLILLTFWYHMLTAQHHIAYEIHGTIKHFKSGQRIYFMRTKTGHALDSVSLNDSAFVFKDEADISNEPDMNSIETNGSLFVDHSGKGINFNQLSVNSFPDMIPVYLEQGVTLVKITDSAIKATIIPPKPNDGRYTLDSIYVARYKNFLKNGVTKADAEQERDLWNFVKTHPTSPVSLYILEHEDENYPDYDRIEPYFDALSPELKNTAFGKQYAAMLAGLKRVYVGEMAPDFTMSDPNGKKISLSSFKGKYVLIDFWASWCNPCREQNPSVVNAYNQYSGKNFTVLGVSLDKNKDAWLQAIMDDNLAWPQVSDLNFWDNAAARLYSIKAIPQNFLVDPSGHIIAKNLFGDKLSQRLKKIFNATADDSR